jgi:hypothetical protein
VASHQAHYNLKRGLNEKSGLAVAELDVTAHVRAILTTLIDLSAHRSYDAIGRWLHTLGYRGHITTKSRLFSTTMGALRAYRAAWTRQHHTEHAARTTDAVRHWAIPTIDLIEWEFDRAGLCSLGERAPDPVGGTADDRTSPYRPR